MNQRIDITKAIQPKSDQLNADSLITGPRTIKVRDVRVVSSEQPIEVYFDGDDNKPWKPCKTAARCLATVWGADASKWIGQSCTIYNDPTVTWAGAAVGGIRVSHMEGLSSKRTLSLTKTRGQKGATVIEPLNIKPPAHVDVAAAKESALASAAKGKDGFTVWWRNNPDLRDAIMPIMGEIKAASEKADAEKTPPQTGDENGSDLPPPEDNKPDGDENVDV